MSIVRHTEAVKLSHTTIQYNWWDKVKIIILFYTDHMYLCMYIWIGIMKFPVSFMHLFNAIICTDDKGMIGCWWIHNHKIWCSMQFALPFKTYLTYVWKYAIWISILIDTDIYGYCCIIWYSQILPYISI